ncbi:unnamed protein product [Gongylonema pulchrum]|uniref:Pseudouridine-5'-monophosphatase n=1 Tax=Gongylonema pulchrum TaxID=637853 RepID=A0A183D1X2_9BILA|nr:unnamed protein product [Gongylonema pulchrum]
MVVTSPQITHVIFDLDGLLLDTETIYTMVNTEMMKSYGREYSMELKAKTTGMKMEDAVRVMLQHVSENFPFDTVTVEEYKKQYKNLLAKHLPESKPLAGAMQLVQHLAKYEIPMAMCSGSDTFEFEAKMRNQKELSDLITLRVRLCSFLITPTWKIVRKISDPVISLLLFDSPAVSFLVINSRKKKRIVDQWLVAIARGVIRTSSQMPPPVIECRYRWVYKLYRLLISIRVSNLQVLTGDDPGVKRGKPAPDGFLETMRRFQVKPESVANVLVFEDSTNGVRAAVAAGMHVVMVPDLRYAKPPEECADKIAFVLKSLEEFKPETMGLAPFD